MGWARINHGNGCNGDQVFDSAARRLVFTALLGVGAATIALAVPACGNNAPQITSAAGSSIRAAGGSAAGDGGPGPRSSAAGGSDPAPGMSAAGGSNPVPANSVTGSVPAAVSGANGTEKSTACPTQGVGGDNLPPLCAVPAPVSNAVSVTPPATPTPTPTSRVPSPTPCPVPTVTNVSPDQGAETGGDTVTITGTGFGEGAGVSFGGTPAKDVTPESGTEITAVSPPEQPGTVDITVSCGGAVSRVVAADKFSYSAAMVPPSSGTSSAGS